jgi:HK97 family phage prohead protease
LEYKSLLEIKHVDDATGEFTGYLAVFGNVDSDSDILVKGAFKVSLASGRTIPILWQHIQTEPIGLFVSLKEDDHGLLVTGKLAIDTALGARAYSLLKMRAINGLSIGYKAIQQERLKGIRYLREVKLFEGSIVTFEANTEAIVTDVKASKTKRVDDEDLHSSAFAYVGDPAKPETWKLPIHFSTPELSAAHIRDALARFDQTEGIPEDEKPKVLAKIRAAADSHGIKAAPCVAETKMKTFKETLAAHELRKDLSNQHWINEDAKDDSMDSIMSDASMDKVAKKAAIRKTLHEAADAHADLMDQRIDATPEIDPDEVDGGKHANDTIEVKAARKNMTAAIAAHVEGERKCMKAMDLIHQASELHTKGIVLARQLSYAGITANDDKNAAAAAGAKAATALLESIRNTITKLAA